MNTQLTEIPQPEVSTGLSHGIEEEPVPIERWIELLVSRDGAERAEAEARLQRGDPEAVQALIAALERENRKKPLRFGLGMAAGILLITAIQTAVGSLLSGHLMVNGGAWLVGTGLAAAFAPTKLQKAVARILAQQDEVRAVGPLSDALDRQDDATKKLAAGALARLLPRLKAGDADLLSPHQRKRLWETLLSTKDPALARGILNAAVQTGDERALTSVERLANGKGLAKKDSEIRGEADAIIPTVKQRIGEEHIRMTLLRPSESPDAPETILLRPAHGAGYVNSDVLLRPADVDGDGY